MSISGGILADAPSLYWKLDDTATPFADSSGHGNTGTSTGLVLLQQQGPEVGTFGIAMSGACSIITVGGTPVVPTPYTMLVWLAPILNPTINSVFIYNGNTALRGAGAALNATPPSAQEISPLSGGGAFGAAGGVLLSSRYHQFAVSQSVASDKAVYIDGVQVIFAAAVPTNPVSAGDKFRLGSAASCFYYAAHAALFPAVLSPSQIATQYGLHDDFANPPFSNPPISSIDLSFIESQLAAILAAVRKTY